MSSKNYQEKGMGTIWSCSSSGCGAKILGFYDRGHVWKGPIIFLLCAWLLLQTWNLKLPWSCRYSWNQPLFESLESSQILLLPKRAAYVIYSEDILHFLYFISIFGTNWNKFNWKGKSTTASGESTQTEGTSRNNVHLGPTFPSNCQIATSNNRTFDTPNRITFFKNISISHVWSCF